MKTRILIVSASVVLFSLIQVGGWAQGKYVPKENEELYGTWTNDRWKQVHSPGECETYTHLTDEASTFAIAEQIDSKWTDSVGNVWYKTFGKITKGLYKGYTEQTLYKLSKSATVLEGVYIDVASYEASLYPTEITDPNDQNYFIVYRSER